MWIQLCTTLVPYGLNTPLQLHTAQNAKIIREKSTKLSETHETRESETRPPQHRRAWSDRTLDRGRRRRVPQRKSADNPRPGAAGRGGARRGAGHGRRRPGRIARAFSLSARPRDRGYTERYTDSSPKAPKATQSRVCGCQQPARDHSSYIDLALPESLLHSRRSASARCAASVPAKQAASRGTPPSTIAQKPAKKPAAPDARAIARIASR